MSENVIITDTRYKFGSKTFSNYKKCDVIKQLINCMYYQKIEESYYWTCELLCSNCIIDLWEVYFTFMSKYIHMENPKLPIYLNKKYQDFKREAMYVENDMEMRNNANMRLIFCTITTIMTLSNKGNVIDNVKHDFDFNVEKLFEHLRAPNMEYASSIFHMNDPKECFVAINELSYHLQDSKNKIYIHYWINWIIEYDALCHKKKNKITCNKREFVKVDSKTLNVNVVWIIWELLLLSSNDDKNKKMIIHNALDLFSVKYKQTTNKKRSHLIFFCVEVILGNVNVSIPLIENNNILNTIQDNINITFEIIKKNEVHELHNEKVSKQDIFELAINNI